MRCQFRPCGNQIARAVACAHPGCEVMTGYCPECGGDARAEREIALHATRHTDGKAATCRWCAWTSETRYSPENEYARDCAFAEQRMHVASDHPKIYRQIRGY